MYEIPALTRAVADISANRAEAVARKQAPVVLDDGYRAMFAKMGQYPPEQAKGLGYCLEPKEKGVLAEYLFSEAKDSEKEVLSYALLEDMDAASSVPIYEKCLENYADAAFRPMFKKLRASKSFVTALAQAYKFKPEPLLDALSTGEAVEYINREAGLMAAEEEGGYIGALSIFGVKESSELFRKCAELYVVVCSAKEYRRLGVERLMSLTADFEYEHRVRLLRNMLNVMDDFQLQAFVPMLEGFIEMTGEKGSAKYKEVLGGVSGANLNKYELWTSKYKIHKALGENEISKFWYDYAGKAAISHLEKYDTLLFDFGKFVVLEILDNEAAYFYDTKYYRDYVYQAFSEATDSTQLEDWLREKTEWSASGEHQSHWRKAHQGQWQLAFRSYINDRM